MMVLSELQVVWKVLILVMGCTHLGFIAADLLLSLHWLQVANVDAATTLVT
jgi:glutamate racemase